ncbi:V-set domain-containing T-cell activation inhibitor 1-like isoform X2 [Anabas testudineus]|uniref:V-set domain-containing T-cell activation inhibitor 1-like isoform X2 n=1 Tax=Anabas testudineus TaxID=64144 RepID=UPI000E465361|nr:V-set domain-containing T-cell activation inhibitor 1-like isoform X2 [Anabas testudineus]
MSAIHTWVCFLLWISLSTQKGTPDVMVTCFISEDCRLPCNFQPDSEATIEWFRQDVMIYKFEQDEEENDGDDEEEDNDDSSSEEHLEQQQVAGQMFISPALVSRGNASLVLKKIGLKDRGTYRCQVTTSKGQHGANVILRVEAPLHGLSLELSRMSGYEEMICTINNVYPHPRVSWDTEPSTFEDLRPVTRMHNNKQGLFMVNSRVKLLKGRPNLIYICKVTSSYGGPAWTASLKEREIKWTQGKDLTIPCTSPSYLDSPSLEWSYSNGPQHSHILTYDSRSGHSTSTPPWNKYVELDGFRVPFGDGSLRLMDPKNSKHTGSYTCMFSTQYNTYTERTNVIIDGPSAKAGETETRASDKPSYWWVAGLVIALLALALVGLLVYMKMKGNREKKPTNDPEEVTELNVVKDAAETKPNESSPFTEADTDR